MKIQELTASERIVLAEMLWDSVDEEHVAIELPERQQAELEQRLQTFIDEPKTVSSWNKVKNRIIAQA